MERADISVETLNLWAKTMIRKWWSREDSPTIIISNKKWKWRYACYFGKTKTIEFTQNSIERQLKRGGIKLVKDTLLHELCHWHLHTSKLPYGDDDYIFAKELIRVGSSPSGTKIGKETYEKANQILKRDVFILEAHNEYNDSMRDEISLIHPRKNQEDFEKDILKTLLRIKEINMKELSEGSLELSYLPECTVQEIAEFMIKWYGYKHEESNVRGVTRLYSDGYGNVMCEDKGYSYLDESAFEENLNRLGMNQKEVDSYMEKQRKFLPSLTK